MHRTKTQSTLFVLLACLLAVGLLILAETTVYAAPVISYRDRGTAPAALREQPFDGSGYPRTIHEFEFRLNQAPSVASTMTLRTSPQCTFALRTEGSGAIGASYTVSISADDGLTLRMGVGAVDDDEYEGRHSCNVTATISSDDAGFNNIKKIQAFSIVDNDPRPSSSSAPASNEPGVLATSDNRRGSQPAPPQPSLDTVTANNQSLSKTGFEVPLGETVIFSGTTIPGGEITLTVYSEPLVFRTTAGNDGSYRVVGVGIPRGQHRVEVVVTDPASELSSEPVEVASFTVATISSEPAVAGDATTSIAAGDRGLAWSGLLVAFGLGLVVASAGTGYLWRRRQAATAVESAPATIPIPIAAVPEPRGQTVPVKITSSGAGTDSSSK